VSAGFALLLSVALLLANGFFVAAEFSLLAAPRSRIEMLASEGSTRAKAARFAIRRLSLMLAAAQLGITMASLGLGALAEPALAHLIEAAIHPIDLPESVERALGFGFGLSIVVFLHMVIGEMVPKSLTIARPERVALTLAVPFKLFAQVLQPIIWSLNHLANALTRLLGVEPQDELALAHNPTDMLLLLADSAKHGRIEEGERLLLSRTLELSGLTAVSAMTMREAVVSVPDVATLADIEDVMTNTGRSRIVVRRSSVDDVVGVVHFRDVLLAQKRQQSGAVASDLATPSMVVRADYALENVLLDMRTEHRQLAIVIEPGGSVVGIVTMEDVLERLIGDFEDETDAPKSSVRRKHT
jgi:CBS domain containing-hemolysin-like protein